MVTASESDKKEIEIFMWGFRQMSENVSVLKEVK